MTKEARKMKIAKKKVAKLNYNDEVINRYGTDQQKRKQQIKHARYKCMKESEWRKIAIDGWEALKKNAEHSFSAYAPQDTLIIGALGEECFDSFNEYKAFKISHSDMGFVQIAESMIEMNRQMISSMDKFASGLGKQAKVKTMIKKAGSDEKFLKSEDVAMVMSRIAESTDSQMVFKRAVKMASYAKTTERVPLGQVKRFFMDKSASDAFVELVKDNKEVEELLK